MNLKKIQNSLYPKLDILCLKVAWYQLMMKERDGSINKEIGNLKKELEVSTMKNQELLQQRVRQSLVQCLKQCSVL